ncbi:hypothetical protein C3747_47g296 [Trypanosoma cruzi]|uniref:Uncharacterized protein n=1 Tax=Trypanosoma cruzi TaxID=5693 RepID=A0A2V2WX93_TRYCR|nr:hypothetical protein C3747_47g296 [Trypanosoma cruzi]
MGEIHRETLLRRGRGGAVVVEQEGGAEKRLRRKIRRGGRRRTERSTESPVSVEEQYRVLRPTTFTAAVIVEDVYGNISVNQVKRQATPLAAYQNASGQALRSEAVLSPEITILDQCLPPAPLITRMRWQFDAMVHRLAKAQGKRPEELAVIRIEGDKKGNQEMDGKDATISKKPDGGVPQWQSRNNVSFLPRVLYLTEASSGRIAARVATGLSSTAMCRH